MIWNENKVMISNGNTRVWLWNMFKKIMDVNLYFWKTINRICYKYESTIEEIVHSISTNKLRSGFAFTSVWTIRCGLRHVISARPWWTLSLLPVSWDEYNVMSDRLRLLIRPHICFLYNSWTKIAQSITLYKHVMCKINQP